jgi:hypothetical protein
MIRAPVPWPTRVVVGAPRAGRTPSNVAPSLRHIFAARVDMLTDIMTRFVPVAILAWCFAATFGPASFATDSLVRADILRYGVVKSETVGTKPSPGAPSGNTGLIGKYDFLTTGAKVEACPGTSFGVEYELNRAVEPGETPLRIVFDYPRQTTPDGRVFTTHDMPLDSGRRTLYAGFTFEYAWEMTSGAWRFRLMQGERELANTEFDVFIGPCLVS